MTSQDLHKAIQEAGRNVPVENLHFDGDQKVSFSDNRSVIINNCVFEGELSIYTRSEITLSNCVLKRLVVVTDNQNRRLRLEGCEVQYILIQETNYIHIINTPIKNGFRITGHSLNQLEIRGDGNQRYFEEINLEEVKHAQTLKIIKANGGSIKFPKSLSFDRFVVNASDIDELNLSMRTFGTLLIGGNASITPSIIKSFNLDAITVNRRMEVKYLKTEKCMFSRFAPNHDVSYEFNSVEFTGETIIENSNLNQVLFLGVDFTNAKLNLSKSLISEATYSNIQWPKNKLLSPDLTRTKVAGLKKNVAKLIQLNEQREVYRQLKSISIKNNNTIDALGFYKNEMRVYYPYAVVKKSEGWWDRFLIWLNRSVSNFGQSFTRPLVWLFGLQYLFYQMIIGWEFYFDSTSVVQGLSKYFFLLNPVHKFPEYYEGLDYVTDFFMRVLSGFFIYHFIKASRKFGKV